MSTMKRVLNPERLRQVPEHFSWLDHRLVREHTIEQADVVAWALYLFLVTVADAMASRITAMPPWPGACDLIWPGWRVPVGI